MKRLAVAVAVAAVLALTCVESGPAHASTGTVIQAGTIDPVLEARLASAGPGQMVDAVVIMQSQADLGTIKEKRKRQRNVAVVRALHAKADGTQKGLRTLLATRRAQGLVSSITPLWIVNGIGVTATPAVIRELAARPEVAEIQPNLTMQAPTPGAVRAPAEGNVVLVNAPALWDLGYSGQGVVVANLDTGVDVSHPDLASRWRGGTNSWYDPNGQHPTSPIDLNGHGTWTMGVMVGGDAGGSSLGMAPDARWIAVKIFNDKGLATSTGIHLGLQWLLDPDGNPATADAPDVVNNSWTLSASGCNLDFQPDLTSLRAAGILPIFAAGNYGPSAGTVFSPANNPEAFAVGVTNNSDVLQSYSSRGPSACSQPVEPQLVAPGVSVRTTDLYGGYAIQSGTSMAAPHAAGAAALLLSAFPDLTADRQEAALESGAVDLGSPGPDNDFGYGRLDALAAYQWLTGAPDFSVATAPLSAQVVAGGTASYTVTVAGVNGFTGDVSLSLAGLPASDAGWSFDPDVIVGGSGSATLTVTTGASMSAGSYALTVSATSGATVRTSSATLDVTTPDFAVGVMPTTVTTGAGGTPSYTVAVSALDGFTGDVSLTASGLPAGVGTATFTPSTVQVEGSSTLSVTTSATAAAGSYPLTITGTSGSTTHSTAVSLVVSPPPDFSVAVTPASRSVVAGGSAAYTVNVGALNGFSDNVSLALTGLPAGVATATFAPTVVSGSGGSQLMITTPPTAPGGSYPLTITGTSGATTHSATVTLVVTSAQDFSLSVSPSSRTIFRTQTASYTVSISPLSGFTGSVALTVSGLPMGVTSSFSRNPVVPPNTSALRISTSWWTPRGTFTVQVSGTSGSQVHSSTVMLTIR